MNDNNTALVPQGATTPAPVLTDDIVKKYICPTATDQERYFFLQLCQAQGLNPFLKEVYLIKYGAQPAAIVTGKETFLKRAARIPGYRGFKAGIILLVNGELIYRTGAMYIKGAETLVGGWADVYHDGFAEPIHEEVAFEEYVQHKSDGSPNRMWTEKPATMIRKVALVQALREAFPDEFGGLYSPEEMPVDAGKLPEYVAPPREIQTTTDPAPDPAPVSDPGPAKEPKIDPARVDLIKAMCKKLGMTRVTEAVTSINAFLSSRAAALAEDHIPIKRIEDLTADQASALIGALSKETAEKEQEKEQEPF